MKFLLEQNSAGINSKEDFIVYFSKIAIILFLRDYPNILSQI